MKTAEVCYQYGISRAIPRADSTRTPDSISVIDGRLLHRPYAFQRNSQHQEIQKAIPKAWARGCLNCKGIPKPAPATHGCGLRHQAQSARLACVALHVLSRHIENPVSFLPNLSSSLTSWQDCEPLEAPALPPTWFQSELELFDKAVSDGFMKTMRQALGLNNESSSKKFADRGCWSRNLRKLAVFDLKKPPAGWKGEAEPTPSGKLESLGPEFRAVLSQVQRLYIYRAIDSGGSIIDFFLSSLRSVDAPKALYAKALADASHSQPLLPILAPAGTTCL